MKKIILAMSIFGGLLINAQTTETQPNRWTYGGGAGLSVSGGYYGTTISVAPRVGYLVTNDLEAGVSGSFSWSSSKYYSNTMLGIGPYAHYYIGRNFYLSGKFYQYFYNQKNKVDSQKYTGDESALYFGAGYLQQIGSGAYMQIGASYNVLYKEGKSIFGNAFYPSVGIVFGL